MNRAFGAKRSQTEITYELLDGKSKDLKVRSLSSQEQIDTSHGAFVTVEIVVKKAEDALRKLLVGNDEKLVEKVIKEQYAEGDIVEFKNQLEKLIRDEKIKKLQDS